jgi:hypothetical protein
MSHTLDPEFAWLLGTDERLAPDKLVGEQVRRAADMVTAWWQLAPIIAPRVKDLARGRRSTADSIRTLEALATSVSTITRVQNLLAWRFARALDANDIPYSLLKGSAARLVAYPESHLRGGLDVDIAIPRTWIYAAKEIAHDQGFISAALSNVEVGRHFVAVDPLEQELVESEHYELACLVRRQTITDLAPATERAIRSTIDMVRPWHVTEDGRLGCYVTLDLHHGLCLDIPVDDAVSSATRVPAADHKLSVPSRPWLLLHLIFKVYWEGVYNYRRGAYQYADVLRLLEGLDVEDATELMSLLEKYQLEAAGHYVLRRVPSDLGTPLSPVLQDYVDRTAQAPTEVFPTDVNDLGDMWPKLWGRR